MFSASLLSIPCCFIDAFLAKGFLHTGHLNFLVENTLFTFHEIERLIRILDAKEVLEYCQFEEKFREINGLFK